MFTFLMKKIAVIMCIPFYTLLERKMLSYSQSRKGPKKVGLLGMMQPVLDGVKLMMKEGSFPSKINSYIYMLSPFFSFMLMVFSWMLFPSLFMEKWMSLSALYFLCWSSLGVYSVLSSGWGSKSKYSFLGAVRGAAQSVSYEMCLISLMFFPFFFNNSFSLGAPIIKGSMMSLHNLLIVGLFFFLFLCETNRAPFDFAEGESELVSGFKTEYSGLVFAFLFLGEYGMILFASSFIVLYFFFKWLFPLFIIFFSISFLLARAAYPRFRYDLLMSLSWNILLPLMLCFFFIFPFFLENSVISAF